MHGCLYGSFLPVPDINIFPLIKETNEPGAFIVKTGSIELNAGRSRITLRVTNMGDRPIQVGSHYHFIETNPKLAFDRKMSYGYRLDIPAGTAVRFEPGECKTTNLVEIAGNKVITGGNGIATGVFNLAKLDEIMKKISINGFIHSPQVEAFKAPNPYLMSRQRYADAYGPTEGDRVRLGDTNLFLQVEKDFTSYGDECVFGGGKVIREGMGQTTSFTDKDCLDLVITNVLVVDYTGIFKADIGIKGGYIVGIGKSGNPDVMHGVTKGIRLVI